MLFVRWSATTCTTESGVRNAHMLHYSMMWSGRKERKEESVEHAVKKQQYYCLTCDNQPLSLGQCFVTWHTK